MRLELWNRTHSSTRARLLLLAICALVAVSAPASHATRVLVEAESYTDSYDLEYEPIRQAVATTCSGQFMLVGLDYPGEWTEYDITIGDFGTWSVGLRCRGDAGVSYTFRFTFTGTTSGTSTSYDVYYTGAGYG